MSEPPFEIKFPARTCNFIKKETLAQVFSCDFCKIFKNVFFREHLRANASHSTWLKLISSTGFFVDCVCSIFYEIRKGKLPYREWSPFENSLAFSMLTKCALE